MVSQSPGCKALSAHLERLVSLVRKLFPRGPPLREPFKIADQAADWLFLITGVLLMTAIAAFVF
jgi:hypothetical protein